ncbi:hypothetical protein [Actinomadura gamaensis]|uniref:Class I SAM-dependent methyltransferase n=1 Tax=Actinomadura gamaensis TaxID=1763541 RepID=A0ABV9U6G5_9ACTN
MAQLSMTRQRWEELSALLKDEQKLQARFPKVAEYLDMAAGLAGTGDDQADAEFDLRFVHYMTGDRSVSSNPYWDIVESSVDVRNGRRVVDGGRPEGSARLAYAQMLLQATYAYAIPSPETVEWVKSFCGETPIVELGAGRGYWAAQLNKAGLNIEAYDSEPPDKVANVSFPRVVGQVDIWHPVRSLDDFAVRGQTADYTLLLCWPPGWGSQMSSQALNKFEEAEGERLVYIGEPRGGKTGNDPFFEALNARWRLESEDPDYVSWWTDADRAQGWVRR